MPTKSPLYTLVYIEDGKPVTMEFRDHAALELHIHTEEISPADDTYALLVDGKEVSWQTKLSVQVNMPQPELNANNKPVRRKRRTKAELEAARLAGEKAPARKLNGSGDAVHADRE